MAAVTFASKLKSDGTLTIPKQAVEELGVQTGDYVKVSVESTHDACRTAVPARLAQAKFKMSHRTKEQIAEAQARAMEKHPPMRAVPPGKTLSDIVSGKWPGDETDEQIEDALRELS